MKGKKTCPNGHIVGARAAVCNECNHTFYKTRTAEKHIDDWRSLRPGQEFKSIGSNGPYYNSTSGRQYTGHYGNFKVININSDGIVATDGKGFCFLYMGQEKPGLVGIMAPHKIELIRTKRNERT